MKLNKEAIIQSNNVTLAKYKMTEIQENVLISIIGHLQGEMNTNQQRFEFDDNRIVQLNVNEIDRNSRNKSNVLRNIKSMQGLPIEFTLPINGGEELEDHCHALITGYSNLRNSNIINVHLNKDIMPWLTYYGKSVGGTKFEQKLAIQLSGAYTKRIYKLFCMNKRNHYFYLSIKYFIDMIGIGTLKKAQDNFYIKDKILDPAIEKINSSDKNINISFEFFVKNKDYTKKKQKADYIKFVNNAPSAEFTYPNDYEFVKEYLFRIFPNEEKTKGRADKMLSHLQTKKCVEPFAERLKQLVFEFHEKEKPINEYRALIQHILNNDYGYGKVYIPGFEK